MKKILPFLAPICLFASSCDELVQKSVNEFYKSDRNLEKAINLAEQASEACLKAGNTEQAITSLINGASMRMVNKEPQKALELSQKALELAPKDPARDGFAPCLLKFQVLLCSFWRLDLFHQALLGR